MISLASGCSPQPGCRAVLRTARLRACDLPDAAPLASAVPGRRFQSADFGQDDGHSPRRRAVCHPRNSGIGPLWISHGLLSLVPQPARRMRPSDLLSVSAVSSTALGVGFRNFSQRFAAGDSPSLRSCDSFGRAAASGEGARPAGRTDTDAVRSTLASGACRLCGKA